MAQATTWLRQSYLLLSPPASSSLAAALRCSPLLSSSSSAASSLLHSRRTNPSLSIPATLCSSSNSSFSPSSAGPKTSADLHLHNTFTKRKEPFRPRVPGKVGMYVCGITAYDLSHIGHARVSVVFDVLYRYLKHLKYDVIYVRNFTDVDDKET